MRIYNSGLDCLAAMELSRLAYAEILFKLKI